MVIGFSFHYDQGPMSIFCSVDFVTFPFNSPLWDIFLKDLWLKFIVLLNKNAIMIKLCFVLFCFSLPFDLVWKQGKI